MAGNLDKTSEDILMKFILDSSLIIGHIMLPHNILFDCCVPPGIITVAYSRFV